MNKKPTYWKCDDCSELNLVSAYRCKDCGVHKPPNYTVVDADGNEIPK